MKPNLQRRFVQTIQKQNTSWKKTNFKCEDCEYTTKGKLYMVKHSAKFHNQFVACGLALPYSSSLELYIKEKYCDNCGKSFYKVFKSNSINQRNAYIHNTNNLTHNSYDWKVGFSNEKCMTVKKNILWEKYGDFFKGCCE